MNAYKVLEVDESDFSTMGFVIAANAREAKKLAWQQHPDTYASYDNDFTKMRVKLSPKAHIRGLKKGWHDASKDALKRGIYRNMWILDNCDKCGGESELHLCGDNEALCNRCIEGDTQ